MYTESQVARYIRRHHENYGLVVAVTADLYLNGPIFFNISSMKTPAKEVATCSDGVEKWISNGLYVGDPDSVAKVMDRFDSLISTFPTKQNYEEMLQSNGFDSNRIKHVVLPAWSVSPCVIKLRYSLKASMRGNGCKQIWNSSHTLQACLHKQIS